MLSIHSLKSDVSVAVIVLASSRVLGDSFATESALTVDWGLLSCALYDCIAHACLSENDCFRNEVGLGEANQIKVESN